MLGNLCHCSANEHGTVRSQRGDLGSVIPLQKNVDLAQTFEGVYAKDKTYLHIL